MNWNYAITAARAMGWFFLALMFGVAGMAGASAVADKEWVKP